MKSLALLFAFALALICTPALADDLHVIREDSIESFTGCTTTRLYLVGNQAQLWMYCPRQPLLRKNPSGLPPPGNSLLWDWYVSIGITVRMGEGCSVRAHFEGAFGFSTTELECRS